jgi:hypothetical protein
MRFVKDDYRSSRLFDLRSTLVHGGCTSIEAWDGFESYRQHTNSEPSKDVTNAAMKALWLSPQLLHLMSPPPPVTKRGNGTVVACSVAFLMAMLLGRKMGACRPLKFENRKAPNRGW